MQKNSKKTLYFVNNISPASHVIKFMFYCFYEFFYVSIRECSSDICILYISEVIKVTKVKLSLKFGPRFKVFLRH